MAAAKTKEVEVQDAKTVAMIESVPLMSRTARQDLVAESSSVAELRERLGAVVNWEDIETSFRVVSAAEFEGKPCVIASFNFNASTKFLNTEITPEGNEIEVPAEFVSMLVAGYDPDKDRITSSWVIVNDGSRDAGIAAQIRKYISKTTGDPRTAPAIRASNGFRKSEYPLTKEKHGTVGTGTTWFIG